MKKEEIFEYVKKQYGTVPEYLWAQSPDNAVLRHKNGKWYAVVMTVEKSKLGLEGNDLVDIMDVKCDPEMTSMIIQTYGFLPGYHMNKQHCCFTPLLVKVRRTGKMQKNLAGSMGYENVV